MTDVTEVVEPGQEAPAVCICDDAFREGECPVHTVEVDEPPLPSRPTVLVKAEHRVEPTKVSTWRGYSFYCSNCEDGSLMHWKESGFKYCPTCGSQVEYEFDKS